MIQVLYIEGPKGSGKSTYIRSLANKLLISAKYNIIFSHDVFEPESFSYVLQGRSNFWESEIEDINNRIKKNGYNGKITTPNDWVVINSAADDKPCIEYFYNNLLIPLNKFDWNTNNLLIITAIRPDNKQPDSLHKQIKEAFMSFTNSLPNNRSIQIDNRTIDLLPISLYRI